MNTQLDHKMDDYARLQELIKDNLKQQIHNYKQIVKLKDLEIQRLKRQLVDAASTLGCLFDERA